MLEGHCGAGGSGSLATSFISSAFHCLPGLSSLKGHQERLFLRRAGPAAGRGARVLSKLLSPWCLESKLVASFPDDFPLNVCGEETIETAGENESF